MNAPMTIEKYLARVEGLLATRRNVCSMGADPKALLAVPPLFLALFLSNEVWRLVSFVPAKQVAYILLTFLNFLTALCCFRSLTCLWYSLGLVTMPHAQHGGRASKCCLLHCLGRGIHPAAPNFHCVCVCVFT